MQLLGSVKSHLRNDDLVVLGIDKSYDDTVADVVCFYYLLLKWVFVNFKFGFILKLVSWIFIFQVRGMLV